MIDKQELITVIRREIDYILQNETRPGWTKWALASGIAGIFWMLVSHLQNASLSGDTIALCMIVGILIWEILIFLRHFLFKTKQYLLAISPENHGDRFISQIESTMDRGDLVFIVIKTIVVFFLILNFNIPLLVFLKILIIAYYSIIAIIRVGALVDQTPTQKGTPSKKIAKYSNTVWGFFLFIFIISFLLLVGSGNYTLFGTNSGQVAVLLLAIMYLISLYLPTIYSVDLLLLSLRNIERDLVFGYIDAATAQEKVDIIIYGMKSGHLFQGYINEIMALSEESIDYQEKINSLFAECSLKGEHGDDMSSFINKIEAYFMRVEKIDTQEIPKKFNEFRLKAQFLAASETETEHYFSLVNRLRVVVDKSKINHGNIRHKISQLHDSQKTYLALKESQELND